MFLFLFHYNCKSCFFKFQVTIKQRMSACCQVPSVAAPGHGICYWKPSLLIWITQLAIYVNLLWSLRSTVEMLTEMKMYFSTNMLLMHPDLFVSEMFVAKWAHLWMQINSSIYECKYFSAEKHTGDKTKRSHKWSQGSGVFLSMKALRIIHQAP